MNALTTELSKNLKIALDYDQTYTRHPEFWDNFIGLAKVWGHEVRVVTARSQDHDKLPLIPPVEDIHYTNYTSKKVFMEKVGWVPDIWVDDNPVGILHDISYPPEQLEAWRKADIERFAH